jgi:hypothetical protein
MSEAAHGTDRCDRPEATSPPARPGRRAVILDVILFQLKLLISGGLHFLLSPATLAAAFLDLIWQSSRHGSRFYRVLEWGHRAEEALGLFAAFGGQAEPIRSDAAA